MKTHKFGSESFHVFDTKKDGKQWMVQFIWGKKDFRVYLDTPSKAAGENNHTVLKGLDEREMVVSKLQYLNNFEWFDFVKVSGHGLAHDEVRWRKVKTTRYVELPKEFYTTAVDIACREFGLERQKT